MKTLEEFHAEVAREFARASGLTLEQVERLFFLRYLYLLGLLTEDL